MTYLRGRSTSVTLVTLGLIVLAAALLWWTIYYAKASTATITYSGNLASLTPCLILTTATCSSVETGNEYPTPGEFFENERDTLPEYLEELIAPNGIARYQPATAWLSLALIAIGIGVAMRTRGVNLSTFMNHDHFVAFVFIVPSAIGFFTFFLYPAFNALLISFHEWNLLRAPKFVGFEKFEELFTDRRFWRSMRITLAYVLWNIPFQTVLALFIAVLLDRTSNWLTSAVRSLMVLPWLLPPVVVGLLWLWMLDPLLGVVNVLLASIGLERQPFLGSPDQVIPAIAGINIWQYTGYTAVLFFAGLKTIPRELYQAASIDGASVWQQFWRITLPLLQPVTIFVLVTSIIGSFQVFDTVAITTGAGPEGGGPAGASSVILYYIFDKIFNRGFDMGLAAAASVALFLVLVTVTIIQLRFSRAGESELADYS